MFRLRILNREETTIITEIYNTVFTKVFKAFSYYVLTLYYRPVTAKSFAYIIVINIHQKP